MKRVTPKLHEEYMLTSHPRESRGQSGLRLFALTLVLVSVCAWGMQYKLSLYRAPSTGHSSIPAAKLLSPRERVAQPSSALHLPPQGMLDFAVTRTYVLPEPDLHVVASDSHESMRIHDGNDLLRFARPPPALS